MNSLQQLWNDLIQRFPNHGMCLDPPADEKTGFWHITIHRKGQRHIVIEWKANDQRFGISSPENADYGIGTDEIYYTKKQAYDRVVGLILSRNNTDPFNSFNKQLRKDKPVKTSSHFWEAYLYGIMVLAAITCILFIGYYLGFKENMPNASLSTIFQKFLGNGN